MSEPVDFSEHDTTGQLAEHSRQTLDEAKKAADEAIGDHAEPDPVPDADGPERPGLPG
ncbi:hypothetical protein L6E12_13140 [Actinokineospora sp. PR83]|uniref:hypothetical protein n=1 Tax=Actinokineospora sp. PR83 TaxID=2884908 RepID=UPI001F2352BB|nr:hypothetical protein [Actinokineospora sp. PR83]MCG8916737.1 hypothetical protein [Actinokineospora sp. PR83]